MSTVLHRPKRKGIPNVPVGEVSEHHRQGQKTKADTRPDNSEPMNQPVSIPTLPVALLSEPDAARYLAIGKTNLRNLGLPRKVLGARRLYHVHDLDEFVNALPYESEDAEDAETGWEDVA